MDGQALVSGDGKGGAVGGRRIHLAGEYLLQHFGSLCRLYQRAQRDYGLKYVDSRPSCVNVRKDGSLYVVYEDHDEGRVKQMDLDMVVLSVGLDTNPKLREIADALGIELDEFGHALTTTAEPMSTTRQGIFVLGAASGPKDIPDTVAQASGAAAMAEALLAEARGTMITEKELPPE